MDWIRATLDLLERHDACGYAPDGPPRAEPTALAALALLAHNKTAAARRMLDALSGEQRRDGGIAADRAADSPGWPTPIAVLGWTAYRTIAHEPSAFAESIQRGLEWLTTNFGGAIPQRSGLGHNTSLNGWPWAPDTHAWLEPTAWSVLALKACGCAQDAHSREGVQLLIDRLLPDGGCNYGNTTVLGQVLRPHLQPSGLVLLALAGEADGSGRIDRSLTYLETALRPDTTAASLAYALLGLAAHARPTPIADAWLAGAAERAQRQGAVVPRLALLLLAAAREVRPVLPFVAVGVSV